MKEDISEKEKTAALLAENRGEAALFQRRENLQKHTSYASERMQYEAIKNGQVERIRSVMQREPDGTPGILSKDQLRNAKICLLQVLRCLPELQLKEEFRKKLHILSVTGIFRQSRNV